ncbi:hypothetical protein ACFWUW_07815 [Streptomyces sp. NPDC058655]|uniref:hypothetical protein n=1 Tax=Streptomyces sp. NPDC058655 TaxID=3346577 RepID=UPI0036568BA2
MPGPLTPPLLRHRGRPVQRGLRALLAAALAATGLASLLLAPPAQALEAAPGSPVVATAGDGTTTAFVRAGDSTLFRRDRDPATGTWSDWTSTGGTTNGDPAVGRRLDGRLEVFAHRRNGDLWHQTWAKGGWGPWSNMGTPPGTTVVGTPVVVTNDNTASSANSSGQVQGNTDGRLELFVRGADNAIWHCAQLAPNGRVWSGWEKLDGGPWAGKPAAVVTGSGRIALVARTQDGHMKATAQAAPGTQQTPLPAGNWAAWTDLGAGWTSDPALVANTYSAVGQQPGAPRTGTLLQVFANRAGNRAWTLAQSEPGTTANPAGHWDTGHPYDLALNLIGPPQVASTNDGRLSVFGVNANHMVSFRSQTHTLTPGSNATGIWNGEKTPLTNLKARGFAVTRTATGAFTVLAVQAGTAKLFARDQLAAGTEKSPPGIWLSWQDLARIGSGPCGGPGSLACLNITNGDLNLALDLQTPTDKTTRLSRATPDTTSATQRWSLRPLPDTTDGTFMIANRNGKCVAEQTETIGPWHLRLGDCATDAYLTKWYLEPVTTSTTAKPTLYRIHQAGKNPGQEYCLTALQNSETGHDPTLVERVNCGDGQANHKQHWSLGRHGATAPGVLDLALQHAAAACASDKTNNTCTFQDTSTPAPYNAPGCVAGDVLYNQSPDSNATYSVSWTHWIGSQWSVAGALTIKFSDVLSTQFTTTHTWIEQDSTARTATITVPPGKFGWLEYAPLARETVGYWKISLNGHSYTVPGHNLSYAKDNTEGKSSLIVTHTATEPPTNATCRR